MTAAAPGPAPAPGPASAPPSTGQLPLLLVLTDRRACEAQGRTLLDTVADVVAAAGAGAAVVLREKDLPPAERTDLAHELRAIAGDITLVVAGDPAVAGAAGTPWVHLAAGDPVPPAPFRWGRSCHDAAELERAAAEGAAYVTLSPVFPTASKPGYGPALGLPALRRHCASIPIPVYALGGITPATAAAAIDAGASGVAVMGAVMAAADPASVVRALLAALETT